MTSIKEFIMEAYADPLKYYEPDPPNTTNPAEAIQKVVDVSSWKQSFLQTNYNLRNSLIEWQESQRFELEQHHDHWRKDVLWPFRG